MCSAAVSFLAIPVRPIISKSTGPIFAKFSASGELCTIDLALGFLSLKERCHDNQFMLVLSTELDAGG